MSEEMNVAAPAAAGENGSAVAHGKGSQGDPSESAQTSANTAQTAVAEGGQTANVNDATFDDTAKGDEGTPSATDGKETGKGKDKKTQSKDTNAEFARKRREAERQRELAETRNKAIIEALGGKNPYTGGEMKDAEDVVEFLTMQEIEKKGGDPVSDYAGHVKEKQRAEREKERTEAERREWYDKDRAAFAEKHPDVDLSALISDEAFQAYSEGKVGEVPLAEIYEGYLRMTARIEDTANRKAAQAVANGKASPGALVSPAAVESDFISAEQVRAKRHDPKWIKANYEKIRKSMPKW